MAQQQKEQDKRKRQVLDNKNCSVLIEKNIRSLEPMSKLKQVKEKTA